MTEYKFDCNPTLETKRLLLRKLTHNDAADIFAYASDEKVSRYTTWNTHQTLEDSTVFLNFVLEKYETGQPGDWAVVEKTSNIVIGTCGWVYWNANHHRAEIGYALSSTYWNKGMMTEAVNRVIEFGFSDMELNRIEARCIIDNISSERVMQKAGMRHEGIIREQMLVKGNYASVNLYSILKREWKRGE